jgi:hypothetical protein
MVFKVAGAVSYQRLVGVNHNVFLKVYLSLVYSFLDLAYYCYKLNGQNLS